ncbi:MAG: NAD(P)-dependent alcohol dehydrogenase [Planctomycetota bacterium]|nr:NAD(P)-dependent alcohol dehydrogenase [Planctomycetaceae bacterium]MDQ3331686.1 NAD(P)-dependent alcohol dehydrogenase [Planctomycetota bacterium]
MSRVKAWTASAAGRPLQLTEYDPGPLGPDDVEIKVEHCGICHSDLSVIDDEWGISAFPLVPGHEVIGTVIALGEHAKGLRIGQRVGVGWNAGSCMHCRQCLSGSQHLCPEVQATIVGHHGGFADRLRSHWAWAIPVPDRLDGSGVGPLLCGGITVFDPFLQHHVLPTARVGVVGIGGLGHMALKFYRAWGCDVTAFTSNESKFEEAKSLGADRAVTSRDTSAIGKLAGELDLLVVTVNASLDWDAYISTLAPKGRMHVVGAVLEPIPVPAMSLIMGSRQVSGSPTGPPTDIATMLDFAARHDVAPQIERFPMSEVNAALDHLKAGKARYRIVLDADF